MCILHQTLNLRYFVSHYCVDSLNVAKIHRTQSYLKTLMYYYTEHRGVAIDKQTATFP